VTIGLSQAKYLSLLSLRDFLPVCSGGLCVLCGFGFFYPQRTRSRRKEHKDLCAIHL